jgi:glycosyltransferase involved in cell wall biosynthesis
MPTLLLEGPFESDYSLAIVNRSLARAISRMELPLRLHQRDNTTPFFPNDRFLRSEKDLAPLFVRNIAAVSADIHSRNIYPPYTDGFRGALRVMHNYAWEESAFPRRYVRDFNENLHLVTTVSTFVRDVLRRNGVRIPVEVVGNGADHILSVAPKPPAAPPPAAFDFLHVSSCFPRKAPEILVRAFCLEFTRRDDVRLLIKTFPNPHNEIERIVAEFEAQYPDHAPIEIVATPLDPGEMRHLYERAGCLVSASRGEGFGLPVAEAMFTGCPVIATIHSGQADTCAPEHCWPVEFGLEPARTHLTEDASLWANPQLDSLREQMRNVYQATAAERLQKTTLAREFVADRFTWKRVAERHWDYCRTALEARRERAAHIVVEGAGPAIGFVTTWNVRCGIAEYARYLATSLPAGHRIAVFANRSPETVRADEDFVFRCWDTRHDARPPEEVEELARAIVSSGVQAVSMQYNFGFFAPSDLGLLLDRLQAAGIVTTVTMHAVRHANFAQMKMALRSADFCICHRQADVEAVRALGVENVLLRKQGMVVLQPDQPASVAHPASPRLQFVVSCFGFFLPPKGIYQLIQAFALAKTVQPLLRLKLLNSLYPIPESAAYAGQCMRLIQDKALGGDVEMSTAFLAHEETLRELADSDLVVLPYLYSTESSSAAGAFAIASLTPVLCSDLPLFDELAEVLHRFPAGDVFALANKILRLAADPAELQRHREAQAEMVRRLAWPTVAQDFAELLGARIARR